jgi:hypothetical protein
MNSGPTGSVISSLKMRSISDFAAVILVSTNAGGTGTSRLRMLMCAIEEELAGARPGAEAIATDLASALFVMVVRTYLDREGRDSGLLAMLAHRQVGRAVAAMVNDPARSWTLDELASCANPPIRMSGPLAGFVTSVARANLARAMTSAIRQRHPSRTYRYRQGWRRFSRRPRRLGTGPARTRSPRHRYYGFRVGEPELCRGRRQAKSASTGDRQPNRKAVVAARRGR